MKTKTATRAVCIASDASRLPVKKKEGVIKRGASLVANLFLCESGPLL